MIIVLLVAAIGLSLSLQGWRSRIPSFDLLPYINDALEFVAHGKLPNKGNLSSYGSYVPPGPVWLMAPGVLLSSDPRLFEYIGTAVVYFGTLMGIYLLAHTYFGVRCAFLSVGLYGLSELGLHVAGSLWARYPIQFFVVWMVYWTGQWVTRRNAVYLAAAIVTWAAGMYVYMEIAPILLILPAIWLYYRPPLRLWPLLVGGALTLVIWYPYLQFEYGRNFVDLKSQLLLQNLLPANYKDTWCDPSLALRNWDASSTLTLESNQTLNVTDSTWRKLLPQSLYPLLVRGSSRIEMLLRNFELVAHIPGASVGLLLLTLCSLFMMGVSGSSTPTRAAQLIVRRRFWNYGLTSFAVGMILCAALANEFIIARYLSPDGVLDLPTISIIRNLQTVLALIGIVILARKRITAIVKQLAQHTENARPLVVSLIIPWIILFFIVEPQRGERLWWLWPLQVVVLAAFFTNILLRLRAPRWVTWIGQVVLIFIVIGNPLLLSQVDAWLESGWSGSDAEQVQAIDYVASQFRSENKDRASIGYQIFIHGFEPKYNILDSQYKVGADFDLLFKCSHGISNTNRCAEGVSPNDEYRIVQIMTVYDHIKEYFNIPLDGSFHFLRQFGAYRVFKRN